MYLSGKRKIPVPEKRMVGSSEPDHLERQGLPSEVGGCFEADGKVELSEGLDALPGNEPMEGRSACLDGGQIDTQEPEGLGVDDVEAAASVHEDLGYCLLISGKCATTATTWLMVWQSPSLHTRTC